MADGFTVFKDQTPKRCLTKRMSVPYLKRRTQSRALVLAKIFYFFFQQILFLKHFFRLSVSDVLMFLCLTPGSWEPIQLNRGWLLDRKSVV